MTCSFGLHKFEVNLTGLKYLTVQISPLLLIGKTFFQPLVIVPFQIVMSSNRVRYGIMASPPNFSMAPGMPSGPTDLFLPNIASRLLLILILMVKVLSMQ